MPSQVDHNGIQLQGNPTGGGESHLFIKPSLRLGDEQIAGAAAPAKQPSNVQVSVGDGKSTATEQLQVRSSLFALSGHWDGATKPLIPHWKEGGEQPYSERNVRS